MKYIVSRYGHETAWLNDYTDDYVLYDRSIVPQEGAIVVENVGSDIYDKFAYIRDNYDNLPDVAVYTKANLFKYITREEFDRVCNNTTFTPLLTKNHLERPGVCFYTPDGMFNEINDYWYLNHHHARRADELIDLLGMRGRGYNKFAPGSNYIVPKENILKHPKEYYEKLMSFLDYAVYPGEAQIIERNLFYIWS